MHSFRDVLTVEAAIIKQNNLKQKISSSVYFTSSVKIRSFCFFHLFSLVYSKKMESGIKV
jgi:hypothetical protein